MKRRKKRQLQTLAILVAALIIIAAVVGLIIWGVVALAKNLSGGKLESITLSPAFAETELDVNQTFSFTIQPNPEKAKLKNLEAIADKDNVTFEVSEDGTTATMHTYNEGVVTVCVRQDKVESNYLTFNVVDRAAAEAAKAAEEAAAAQAAAEEAAKAQAAEESLAKKVQAYVRTNDKVRIRKSPSTDTNDNIITTCEIGDVYLRLEEVDDWSRIVYEDGEAYIKSEFLDVLTDEEAAAAQEEQKNKEIEDALKKAEEQSKQATATDPVAAAAADAAKAADAAAAQAAAAQAEADAAAAAEAAQAAQAAQAASAAGVPVVCKDGTGYFTQGQVNYFHGLWDYTGQYEEMVSHHSIGELKTLCQNAGVN